MLKEKYLSIEEIARLLVSESRLFSLDDDKSPRAFFDQE